MKKLNDVVNNQVAKTQNSTRYTAQKMKFSIKHLFSECDQIRRKLRFWSHLLKKSLIENFILCAVILSESWQLVQQENWTRHYYIDN